MLEELFENTKCLVTEVYASLVGRHAKANMNGSAKYMDELDEVLAYKFLFDEYDISDIHNNILSIRHIEAIRTRVMNLNKKPNFKGF